MGFEVILTVAHVGCLGPGLWVWDRGSSLSVYSVRGLGLGQAWRLGFRALGLYAFVSFGHAKARKRPFQSGPEPVAVRTAPPPPWRCVKGNGLPGCAVLSVVGCRIPVEFLKLFEIF